jgi:prepilin-type N-terminal cleavage/methylation domain-containing protein
MDRCYTAQVRANGEASCGARRGFTLIELLTVIVLIGIIAAIALQRYSNVREKAHRAQMVSDLRSLISAEESYFSDHLSYVNNLNQLAFNKTAAVSIEIPEADGTGWSAKATHNATSIECGLYVGSATAPSGIPATEDGVITCTS